MAKKSVNKLSELEQNEKELEEVSKYVNSALGVFCSYCPFCGIKGWLKIRRKGTTMIQKECEKCKGRFSFNPRQMLKQMKIEYSHYPNDRQADNFYKYPMMAIEQFYPYKHQQGNKNDPLQTQGFNS